MSKNWPIKKNLKKFTKNLKKWEKCASHLESHFISVKDKFEWIYIGFDDRYKINDKDDLMREVLIFYLPYFWPEFEIQNLENKVQNAIIMDLHEWVVCNKNELGNRCEYFSWILLLPLGTTISHFGSWGDSIKEPCNLLWSWYHGRRKMRFRRSIHITFHYLLLVFVYSFLLHSIYSCTSIGIAFLHFVVYFLNFEDKIHVT